MAGKGTHHVDERELLCSTLRVLKRPGGWDGRGFCEANIFSPKNLKTWGTFSSKSVCKSVTLSPKTMAAFGRRFRSGEIDSV